MKQTIILTTLLVIIAYQLGKGRDYLLQNLYNALIRKVNYLIRLKYRKLIKSIDLSNEEHIELVEYFQLEEQIKEKTNEAASLSLELKKKREKFWTGIENKHKVGGRYLEYNQETNQIDVFNFNI